MKLSDLIKNLNDVTDVRFELPGGIMVPSHFHVTEIGQVSRNYIDCGGTMRKENSINLQLWFTDDYDHRLSAQKLLGIIQLAQSKLGLPDDEIEVEYQGETIGKYKLAFNAKHFLLIPTQTNCLAQDNCGIPITKQKIKLSDLNKNSSCCEPGDKCC